MSRRKKVFIAVAIAALALGYVLWPGGDDEASADNPGGSAADGLYPGGRSQAKMPYFRRGAGAGPSEGLVRVEGTVVDAITGDRVGSVDVALINASGEATANSDSEGRFTVDLVPGLYRVRADGDGIVGLSRAPLLVGHHRPTLRIRVVRLAQARGKVVDGRDAPIVGATITATSTLGGRVLPPGDFGDSGYGVSGSDGTFSVSVIPGEVELIATAEERTGGVWVSGVSPGAHVDDLVIQISEGVAVSGRVHSSNGRGVEGATVLFTVYVGNEYERHEVVTGGAGRFEAKNVPPGQLTIEAWLDGQGATKEATYVTLAEGESKADVELLLDGPVGIEGKVVDAKGKPLSWGTKVAAMSATSRRPLQWVRVEADGTFSLPGLAPGPHTLYAHKQGFAQLEQAVTPPATVELRMVQGGAIRGTILDSDGDPVPAFSVHVERFVSSLDERPRRWSGPSPAAGSNGSFEIDVTHPGSYDIVIAASGLASERRTVEVPVEADATVELRLKKSAALEGRVSAAGSPVSGARVAMLEGYAGSPVFTDNDGRYRLDDVAPGARSLSVSKRGYRTHHQDGLNLSSGARARADVELAEIDDSELVGIGAIWSEMGGRPVIFGVERGSPAEAAELQRDDTVVGIDGIPTYGMSREGARELVRGPRGTPVRLDIERKGQAIVVRITR